MVILDISDITKPRLVSRLSFGDIGSHLVGCHTVLPIPERKLAIVNSEAIEEDVGDPLNYVFVVDISDDEHPKIISSYPLPVPEPGLAYTNYYQKGGRFGPHNQHHPQEHPNLMSLKNKSVMTYFNAGLRIFDISDPYVPIEVAYFMVEDPKIRLGLMPKRKLVTQFEDVIIDKRGCIYCTDKNYGLFILRYKGELD